jgi:hypothetical protein
MRDTVNQIRSDTKMQRVFLYAPSRALAMRGTADQLARALQMIPLR